jgi:hypothetical protein
MTGAFSFNAPAACRNYALVIRLSRATGRKEGPLDPRLPSVRGVDGLLVVFHCLTSALSLQPKSVEGVSKSTTGDGWRGIELSLCSILTSSSDFTPSTSSSFVQSCHKSTSTHSAPLKFVRCLSVLFPKFIYRLKLFMTKKAQL